MQKVHLLEALWRIYGSVLGPDFGSKVRTESKIRTFQKNGLSSIPSFNAFIMMKIALLMFSAIKENNNNIFTWFSNVRILIDWQELTVRLEMSSHEFLNSFHLNRGKLTIIFWFFDKTAGLVNYITIIKALNRKCSMLPGNCNIKNEPISMNSLKIFSC